jgi:hypothetical protein
LPTFLQQGPWRFFVYSNDMVEPPHVHVEGGDATAKFWLDDGVTLARNRGFDEPALNRIRRTILGDLPLFREKWDEFEAHSL